MSQQSDLVIIRTYNYRHEAEVDRSMLEARGIDAIILPGDVMGGRAPWPGGIRLLVRRDDEHRVRRLFLADVKKQETDRG